MVERRRPRGWSVGSDESGNASGGDGNRDGGGDGNGTAPRGTEHYEVGFGKPPLHSRFVPGRSGNPQGRRKGARNLKTDVRRTLAAPVKMRVGDRMRTRSTQETALMILRGKALNGNDRALDKLLELARHHNNEDVEAVTAQSLSEDDQAILSAYVAESTAKPSEQSGSKAEGDPSADASFQQCKKDTGP